MRAITPHKRVSVAAMRAEDIEDERHLFVDDDELRRRINPKIGRDRFRSALRALEAKFPQDSCSIPRALLAGGESVAGLQKRSS
jgi:hypothetical protein